MLTKEDALAHKKRWERINAAEVEELRATPLEQKARQLAALMASAEAFGWTESRASEEIDVRKRWNVLREKYRS